ncbi:MAG: hypothetical protein KBC05_04105 [Candidatus Hydrogenedentes bacterium]|nr:hypothetical protein [Candidatus Hydrogenedentota bacterium]
MYTKKPHVTAKGRFALIAAGVLSVLLLLPLTASLVLAQSQTAEPRDVEDAVLGTQQFTPEELGEMDANADNTVDVADLVALSRQATPASFEVASSEVVEGGEPLNIVIELDPPYTGPLEYVVAVPDPPAPGEQPLVIPATEGEDYVALPGIVQADGASAEITLTILDDLETEPIETVNILLRNSSGLLTQHVVAISDNDAVWQGSLVMEGATLPIEMVILRQGGAWQASLTEFEDNAIPPGNCPVSLNVTDSTFGATIGPVTSETTEDYNLIDAQLRRTIILDANPGARPEDQCDLTDPSLPIQGQMSYEIAAPVRQYLDTAIQGRFVLYQGAEERS